MPLPLTTESVVRASRDQVSAEVAGDTVVLGMTNGVYYGLDHVGTRIWQLLKEARRVQDLCNAITAEYDVDSARAEQDVLALLHELAQYGLIEVDAA